jgi:hypothetical protein
VPNWPSGTTGVNHAFDEAKDFFEKVNTTDSRQFIDDLENGRKQTNPALQPIADSIRTILDDRLKQVQALGTGKLAKFVEDYFPHLWDDPTKAKKCMPKRLPRPRSRAKEVPQAADPADAGDGIAKGLTPITENPVEAMMLRVREMDKYITATPGVPGDARRGLLKKIAARDQVPAGYAKINDNIATLYAKPSRRGAIQVQATTWHPSRWPGVINNYLSPGLRGNKHFGKLFRTYLGAGNVMNQVQLGLSGFHLLNTTLDSGASKLALAFKQLAARDFKNAGKSTVLAASLAGPAIENVWKGSQLLKEWKNPGSTTPEIAAIADVMKAAGGRIGWTSSTTPGRPRR